MKRHICWLMMVLAGPVLANVISYEGTSFPEQEGWVRSDRPHLADRWLDDGWFVQYAEIVDPGPPELPEDDFYRWSLGDLAAADAFFVEWCVETDGPREGIEGVAPAVLTASGRAGIFYHFTIADDQMRFIDSDSFILWVDIAPDMPHTYRLELLGEETYAWYLDGQLLHSGIPAGPYPTADSRIGFGGRAAGGSITVRWDYIRFGVVPEPATGLCLILGAIPILARGHRRGRRCASNS